MASNASNLRYSPGDIIQECEWPFIKCLNSTHKDRYCHCCFKACVQLITCSACKSALYCDLQCQAIDWETCHSIECKFFALPDLMDFVAFTGQDAYYQVLKIMAFLKQHGDKAKKMYQRYDGTSRCFDDLRSNVELMKECRYLVRTSRIFSSKLASSQLFSEEECGYEKVLHYCELWQKHGFSLNNATDSAVIGSAIFVVGASFEHSCRPNAIRIIDDSFRLQIRCIEPIPHGVIPKISYLAGIHPKKERLDKLDTRYFIKSCECELCVAEKKKPLIDYADYHRRRQALKEEPIFGNEELIRAKRLISEMEMLFFKYDERITNYCTFILEELVDTLEGPHSHLLNASDVKELADQVEEKLRICYGTEHNEYIIRFQKHLLPRLQTSKFNV